VPKLTFYPLGNAETTLIELATNELVLFDYANMRNCDGDVGRGLTFA
jgi:hypothetical protein